MELFLIRSAELSDITSARSVKQVTSISDTRSAPSAAPSVNILATVAMVKTSVCSERRGGNVCSRCSAHRKSELVIMVAADLLLTKRREEGQRGPEKASLQLRNVCDRCLPLALPTSASHPPNLTINHFANTWRKYWNHTKKISRATNFKSSSFSTISATQLFNRPA